MSAENRLYFFRMCAWGMFDPDQLPKSERKVRIRQIRQVIEECGFILHISGDRKKTFYALHHTDGVVHQYPPNTLPNICRFLLPAVNAKFSPPKE